MKKKEIIKEIIFFILVVILVFSCMFFKNNYLNTFQPTNFEEEVDGDEFDYHIPNLNF